MTAKQLTDSILQLAIQGKLVPQNPGDEPASVLLDRIREEKKRLVKEGKLKKKDLEEIPISDDEIPFAIPESWEWCRMATYLDVRDGTHESPKYYSKGIPFVTSKNLCDGKIDFSTCKFISEEDHKKFSARSYVENNDIIFAMIGSIGNPVIVKKDREFSIKNVALFKRYNKDCTNVRYLYFYLLYVQDILKSIASGGVQSFIGLSTFRDWIMPIPPLEEQERIACRLEQILPYVKEYGVANDEQEQMNAELPEKLKKSILQEAIMGKLGTQDPNDEPASVLLDRIREEKKQLVKTGVLKKKDLVETQTNEDNVPFVTPDNWAWCKVDTLFMHSSGKQLKGGDAEGILHKYITTSNLYWDRFVLDNLKSMYYKDSELDKCTATKGDLLVCEGGDVGRCAIWPFDYDICLQNHVHRLRPYYAINVRYIMYVFMLYKAKGYIGGKGIGIKGLSASALKDFDIPLPPLAEQHRIVEKIEALFAEVDNIEI